MYLLDVCGYTGNPEISRHADSSRICLFPRFCRCILEVVIGSVCVLSPLA